MLSPTIIMIVDNNSMIIVIIATTFIFYSGLYVFYNASPNTPK